MPSVMPNAAARAMAALVKTALDLSVLSLIKTNIAVGPLTTKAELEAVEADFSGYAAKTITAFNAPFSESDNGATLVAPSQIYVLDGTANPIVPNTVYGWWLEDAGGELIACGTFASPKLLEKAGDALPVALALQMHHLDKISTVLDLTP